MNKVQLTLDAKTSKNGNTYIALVADLGYCKRNLVFDKQLLTEIFDCPPSVLKQLPTGVSIPVGYLSADLDQRKDK